MWLSEGQEMSMSIFKLTEENQEKKKETISLAIIKHFTCQGRGEARFNTGSLKVSDWAPSVTVILAVGCPAPSVYTVPFLYVVGISLLWNSPRPYTPLYWVFPFVL